MAAVVDTSELQAHVFALRASGPILIKSVEGVTKLASQRVRDTARNQFVGTRYWGRVPSQITADVKRTGGTIEAEIGRKRGIGGQGQLMHLLEYGSSRFGPIKPSLGPALSANEEPYVKALGAAAALVAANTT